MPKCVTVYANISVREDIEAIFRGLGVDCYSCWPRLVGTGRTTGPRFDSHVWPGANCAFQVVTDNAAAQSLMEALRNFKKTGTGSKAGLFAFVVPVEETLF